MWECSSAISLDWALLHFCCSLPLPLVLMTFLRTLIKSGGFLSAGLNYIHWFPDLHHQFWWLLIANGLTGSFSVIGSESFHLDCLLIYYRSLACRYIKCSVLYQIHQGLIDTVFTWEAQSRPVFIYQYLTGKMDSHQSDAYC